MQNENNNLGVSLIGSIWEDDNTRDLTAEVVETGLDIVTEEGIIKDIPVVGIFAKIFAISGAIRGRIFTKKIALFLKKATELSVEEKESFREKFEGNEEYRKRVGEELILLLEKHETFEKSAILGGFFKIYIQGKITLDDFRIFAFAIERIYLNDLKALAYQRARSPLLVSVPNSLKERLYPSGLLSLKFTPELTVAKRQALTDKPSKLWFEINEKGKLFASILLEVIEIEEKDF